MTTPAADPLAELVAAINAMDTSVFAALTAIHDRVWPLQYKLRKDIMTVRDDIRSEFADVLAKARAEKDIKAALNTTIAGLQANAQALSDKIAQLQATTGDWTDADVAEIKGGLDAIRDALDPQTVVDAVVTGTPAADPTAGGTVDTGGGAVDTGAGGSGTAAAGGATTGGDANGPAGRAPHGKHR